MAVSASKFILPAAIALVGIRVFTSQVFKSSKYGATFDFGEHHQLFGACIVLLAILLLIAVFRSEKNDQK